MRTALGTSTDEDEGNSDDLSEVEFADDIDNSNDDCKPNISNDLPLNTDDHKRVPLNEPAVSLFVPTSSNVLLPIGNVGVEPEVCLVIMQKGENICFQGHVLVAPIFGDVSIMGHRMRGPLTLDAKMSFDVTNDLVFQPIFSPRTHSLVVIESISEQTELNTMSSSGIYASTVVKSIINELLGRLSVGDQTFHSILAFRGMLWCGITGIERVSPLYKILFSFENSNKRKLKNNENFGGDLPSQQHDIFRIRGFYPLFEPVPGLTLLKYPTSWVDTAALIAADLLDQKKPRVIIVSGHKKTGKSTFAKYLVNTMLNRIPKVAYIESDIGQPEFTPPGLVSLNIVESPILGPPFTHLHQPYRSYFIGQNSPRDSPDYYLECLRELVALYRRDIARVEEFSFREDVKHSWVPLVINTHGWVKGMGYDLYLHILGFTDPTHICQLHSATHPFLNLPPLPTSIFPPTTNNQRSVIYVESIHLAPDSNKFTASYHRTLAMLSYFYSFPFVGTRQSEEKWWDFDSSLTQHVPWCLDWKEGLTKGVFMLFGDVPWSQLLYALNGSIVGLIRGEEEEEILYHTSDNGKNIQAPLYYPSPEFPPPSPTHYTCLGMALIRSIDPDAHTFHILCPLPPTILTQTNAIVKGALELPVWAMLDANSKISTGISRKRIPYLTWDVGRGVGHSATRVRKNLMRRRQMK